LDPVRSYHNLIGMSAEHSQSSRYHSYLKHWALVAGRVIETDDEFAIIFFRVFRVHNDPRESNVAPIGFGANLITSGPFISSGEGLIRLFLFLSWQ